MVTTHLLANQRVKAIRKVVLEDSNTMKDILDPSSVGFRPHQVLLLSISYATSTVQVPFFSWFRFITNLSTGSTESDAVICAWPF